MFSFRLISINIIIFATVNCKMIRCLLNGSEVNQATLYKDGVLNKDFDAVFGEEFSYDNIFTAGGTSGAAQYNGNISGMTWKTKGPLVDYSSKSVSAYAFEYDKLNRLKLAGYGSGSISTTVTQNPIITMSSSHTMKWEISKR